MNQTAIELGPFDPTWESLRGFSCPAWFRDAKLGIWSHWGPQSVPMYGDWYAQHMYVEGSDQYRYHLRKYGHPSQFGYKDIIALWKAEQFDPEALMRLYVEAGARYFVAQAAHHDNFHNWPSTQHRWNSVAMGPGKDIVGLWRDAARRHGLRYGLSEHIGATYSWWVANKGSDTTGPLAGVPYDGNDPAYEDLYLPNRDAKGWRQEWYTTNPWWHERWSTYVKELIDLYQPDLLYSDGGVPFGDVGLRAIAHLYNTSARLHGGHNEAVYTQKDRDPQIFKVGALDIECSQLPAAMPYVWQTDTFVGDWFYNLRAVYKTPKHVAEIFVDVVSKNGNLLLNIPQRPDGTIDDECRYVLEHMARWIAVNGNGIYETRPWRLAAEGPSRVATEEQFKEDPVDWTAEDFRFTCKANTVYAFHLKWPEDGKTLIKSLALGGGDRVSAVTLLGHGEPLSFEQTGQGLVIDLPEKKPCEYVQCYAVVLA